MNINEEGLAIIKGDEGLRLHPYLDSKGVPTQGYGHTKGVTMQSPPITARQAEEWLQQDLSSAESDLSRMISVPLNQNQFSALVSFVFNEGGTKFRISTLRALVNGEAWQQAADEFTRWIWGTQPDGTKVKLQGLIERRAAERTLFLKPVIVADNGPVAV